AFLARHNDTHSDDRPKADPRAPRKPIRYRRKLSMAWRQCFRIKSDVAARAASEIARLRFRALSLHPAHAHIQ
ncbi:MAG: hypothetical protein WBW06_04455, partial [Xanthobacteraceae bacterium]